MRAFLGRLAAFLGLLAGVAGCSDRARPTFGGIGNGIGPISLVTTPAEFDTVTRGVPFTLGVRVEDEDGVDSLFVIPSDTLMAGLRAAGDGEAIATASYTPFVSNAYSSDTLVISVYGIDLLGDTGAVYTRHLIVQ